MNETGTYLDRILHQTAKDLDQRKQETPLEVLQGRIQHAPPIADVARAFDSGTIGVIAEIKRASPSKGRFPAHVVPSDIAGAYIAGGAVAISCLTDEPFFQGSLADLGEVARVASQSDPTIPVLRKDFVIDPYQIDEARAYGASMVLLIVAILDDRQLLEYREYAESLGMAALVEIHDAGESARAVESGATIIGINNRNLRTFEVDLAVTERLAESLPAGTVIVGESGIFTREHVERLAPSGISAVLVGESLILQPDRAAAVQELSGVARVR